MKNEKKQNPVYKKKLKDTIYLIKYSYLINNPKETTIYTLNLLERIEDDLLELKKIDIKDENDLLLLNDYIKKVQTQLQIEYKKPFQKPFVKYYTDEVII
jgi:hypothetical protein